jgi:nucleoside-diphosphate-sugar epimerase
VCSDGIFISVVELLVYVTRELSKMCSPVIADCMQVPLLYISTDYVFDGKSPPYAVDAVPSPLNLYGKTKLDGEKVTLEVGKGNIFMNDNKYS